MARKLGYFFRETFLALRRNALVTFAAITSVCVSLFLLGGSLLIARQVRLMAGEWASRVEVSVFLRDTASPDEIDALGRQIAGLPEVEQVFFETREQAYEQFKRLFRDSPSLVQSVSADALPQSFRIKLKDPEKFSVIRVRLAGNPAVDQVKDEQRLLKQLFRATQGLRAGAIIVASIMLIAAAALIANTVRLAVFARRKEIAIMKLVGATNWFIRVPFLIEGVMEGLIGAVVAILIIFALKVVWIDPLRGQVPFVPTWIGTGDILVTVPLLLAAGVLISVLASLVAMRRFLDV